ncbi:increased DNA methylation 2-like [Silene latifolia]|uniref:increased DNA methylation 2-like n=1 Tax=Silene latifolia TaxID=37657 RepID=UPI003D779B38
MIPCDDCYFLLYFIMGTYFGPDLKGERIKRSALQRIEEGLPSYTLEQLAGSSIKTSEIEQIYYYLLRKADKSVVVKVPLLHQFIQGDFPSKEGEGDRPQFPSLFPPHLHPKMEYFNESIANVTYIRKPAFFYIKQEDIEKFKRLSRLENLLVETSVEKGVPNGKSPTKKIADKDSDDVPIVTYFRGSQRKRRLTEILQKKKPVDCNGAAKSNELALKPSEEKRLKPEIRHGPGIVILNSEPTRQELDSIVDIAKNAYALTGSAAKGIVGSAIGLMDIGESQDSYLFRVALPGVKRENRAFQCEVESDGRVLIKGETVTGETTVNRFSQDFVMQSRNLCPPGPFSISFHLPGPVDPQQFSGTFGTSAILEGIVMKSKPSRPITPNIPTSKQPSETPKETPPKPPAETPKQPSEAPKETPPKQPSETPKETLPKPPAETPKQPSEAPKETPPTQPSETPKETLPKPPAEIPKQPSEAPKETPSEQPSETPKETLAKPPAETSKQPSEAPKETPPKQFSETPKETSS